MVLFLIRVTRVPVNLNQTSIPLARHCTNKEQKQRLPTEWLESKIRQKTKKKMHMNGKVK